MSDTVDKIENVFVLVLLAGIALAAASLIGVFKDFDFPAFPSLPDWFKNPLGMAWSPTNPGDDGYDDPNYNPSTSEEASNAVNPTEQEAYEATNPLNGPFVENSIANSQTAAALVSLIPGDVISDPGAALAGAGIF